MSENNENAQGSSGESQPKKGETITIKKEDLWKYSTFILAAIVVIGAFVMFVGDNAGTTGNVVAPTNPTAPTAPSVVSASADDDAVLGDPNAPITIIEFSDYQCPFCGRFWSETLPSLKSEYIETGKAKLVFRDFPLNSIHPQAQIAGEATECVREQGGDEAFFDYHDTVFQNQGSLSQANLEKWASDMGYDISDCLDSGKYTSEVQKDTQDAQAAGGRGTPYFVILDESGEGTAVSGAQPFANFKSVIDSKL